MRNVQVHCLKLGRDITNLAPSLAIAATIITPLCCAAQPPVPTLLRVTLSFNTTTNDKDWDTNIKAWLKVAGGDVATLDCCSSDRKTTGFPNNSVRDEPMAMVNTTVPKGGLSGAQLTIGSTAHGNDEWIFIPTLKVAYSDGTLQQWSFSRIDLYSHGSGYVATDPITIP